MGKIVKYCGSCDESFLEKFSFCPNCASALNTYELNPVVDQTIKQEPVKVFEPASDFTIEEQKVTPITEKKESVTEPIVPTFLTNNSSKILLEEARNTKPEEKVKAIQPANVAPVISAPINEKDPEPMVSKRVAAPIPTPVYRENVAKDVDAGKMAEFNVVRSKKVFSTDYDGSYHPTLVSEVNSGRKNLFMTGSFLLVMTIAIGSVVGSIYNSDAYIASIDDDFSNLVYVDEAVPTEEPKMPEPKNKDKGGGGGGGGQKDTEPVSKGVLASQSEKPLIPPSAKMDKVTNPELVLRPETQGNRKEKPSDQPYGDPNSRSNISSDGPGSGGGQGIGSGRGQGSGRGTGAGSGDGSGNGSGIGNGNGGGRGNGDNARDDDRDPPPTVKKPVGETASIKILAKPRPPYTDAARQAQVQGIVRLRVTFNANGSIGGITPISGLPNGLTEQAIAAARNIRFEPAKVNGVPQTVSKVLEYNFSMF